MKPLVFHQHFCGTTTKLKGVEYSCIGESNVLWSLGALSLCGFLVGVEINLQQVTDLKSHVPAF